jgi:hypothetical protein
VIKCAANAEVELFHFNVEELGPVALQDTGYERIFSFLSPASLSLSVPLSVVRWVPGARFPRDPATITKSLAFPALCGV